jgi:hypothetical protein
VTCTRATIWVLCDKFVSISAFCSSECARCQLFCRNAANGRCQSVLPDPLTPGNSEGAGSNDPAPLGCVARAALPIAGSCENPETKSQ